MSKDFLDKNEEDENENIPEQSDETTENINEDGTKANDNESKESVIKPRKRKIVSNCQLVVCIIVVAAIFLTVVTWQCFFNQSIVGVWHFTNEGEYTETYDDPASTADGPASETTKYSQRVSYEFTDDGQCIVTLGTMSVTGQYSLFSTENGNMFSAMVYYNYISLLYGSYNYEIKGNVFTGRTLVITDSSTGEQLELEEGEGENPLTPFENINIDDRVIGTWKDNTLGITYTFEKNGYMLLDSGNGMVVQQAYTVDEENSFILVKYAGAEEESYSYTYSINDDGNLTLDDSVLEKVTI